MIRLRHTPGDVEEFARASADLNPLHTSKSYARPTPWGELVVFGVLGGLCCLGLLRGRPGHELAELTLDFPGAMFVGTDYEVRITEDGDDVAKVPPRRPALLKLTARSRGRSVERPGAAAGPAAPRTQAVDRAEWNLLQALVNPLATTMASATMTQRVIAAGHLPQQ